MPHVIPDNNAAGIDSILIVPGASLRLRDLSVRLDDIKHSYVSDLVITLIAPDSSQVLLADRVGGDTDNFYHTVLVDGAAAAIVDGSGPFTGAYRSDQPLATLDGHGSAGIWKLHLADLSSRDVGTLYAWALEVCTDGGTPPPPPPPPVSTQITAGGGSLQLQYLITADVTFPSGAATSPFIATLSVTGTRALPTGRGPIGSSFFLDAETASGPLTSFSQSVTLRLHYDEAVVPDFDVSTLRLYYGDIGRNTYTLLPASIDLSAGTVVASLDRRAEFILLAKHDHHYFLPVLTRQ